MKKKVVKKAKKRIQAKKPVQIKNELSDVFSMEIKPIRPTPQNGECTVEFNEYIVIYSNNVVGNQQSPWRSGGTCISCYKDGQFVGVIDFYETKENMKGGYIDPNGVVVIEYPISRFEDILHVLKQFDSLYLAIVERDNNGVALPHRVGAVMSLAKRPVG